MIRQIVFSKIGRLLVMERAERAYGKAVAHQRKAGRHRSVKPQVACSRTENA
jgi:hypothetical protein